MSCRLSTGNRDRTKCLAMRCRSTMRWTVDNVDDGYRYIWTSIQPDNVREVCASRPATLLPILALSLLMFVGYIINNKTSL